MSSREVEFHNRASIGQQVTVDPLVNLPHQQGGVEFLGPRLAERTAHSPGTERLDHFLEILSCRRQVIFGKRWTCSGQPLDDTRVNEVAQTRREQRPRDPGQPPLDVVEAMTPENHLSDNQERPSISEYFRCARDGTVLVVLLHGHMLACATWRDQSKK